MINTIDGLNGCISSGKQQPRHEFDSYLPAKYKYNTQSKEYPRVGNGASNLLGAQLIKKHDKLDKIYYDKCTYCVGRHAPALGAEQQQHGGLQHHLAQLDGQGPRGDTRGETRAGLATYLKHRDIATLRSRIKASQKARMPTSFFSSSKCLHIKSPTHQIIVSNFK